MRVDDDKRLKYGPRAVGRAIALLLLGALPAGAQTTAPQPSAKPASTAQQVEKTPTPKALNAWRGKVLAHLNQYKRAVASSDATSIVAFGIDRSGKVLSARIVTSSGNTSLDQEAVALTQRASPVPAPPSDVAGSPIYLKVPIRFTR